MGYDKQSFLLFVLIVCLIAITNSLQLEIVSNCFGLLLALICIHLRLSTVKEYLWPVMHNKGHARASFSFSYRSFSYKEPNLSCCLYMESG